MKKKKSIYNRIKRFFDFVTAFLLGLTFSPLLFVIALAVKVTSKGPIFYRWQVVGEEGRYFTGYKFRSMFQNAEHLKEKLLLRNEMTGPMFKLSDDPRITPVGKFLRKFSLDELPQLWSVIKGDMSLVGPRPPLQTEYERFNDWQKQKLAVKPGITCLWQTQGRNEIFDFDKWVKLDLEYIEKRSFWLDMKILLDTVRSVAKGTGR
jgi:lipopolysaccharide/colanic/teichoic acid biosynthesis glycosyltransferase